MPWRCPACQAQVRHDALAGPPDPKDAYRCHVCRLNLRFDPIEKQMVIAPLERDHQVSGEKPSTLIIPPAKKKG